MNGSKGRSPWLCQRSWIMSQSTYVSSARSADDASAMASGGMSIWRTSTPLSVERRNRDDSRSQKIAAEVVRRPLGDAHRLGEEHRALAVVARGVVHQLHRNELGIVVELPLDLGDELRPGRAGDQRFEACVRRPVGRVQGEDDEVLDAVLAMQLRTEEVERRPEVRLAAAALDPVLQVDDHLGEVVLLVRESGARDRRWPRPSSPRAPGPRRRRVAPRSISPFGSCRSRRASVASLRRSHAGSCAASETIGVESERNAASATQ